MKLKILKDLVLANRRPINPHWSFAENQIVETRDTHLIKRLLELNAAKEIKNESKMKKPEKNKMVKPDLNKSKD